VGFGATEEHARPIRAVGLGRPTAASVYNDKQGRLNFRPLFKKVGRMRNPAAGLKARVMHVDGHPSFLGQRLEGCMCRAAFVLWVTSDLAFQFWGRAKQHAQGNARSLSQTR
jgi:hypothetical protein